jgi:hypothetical protein
MARVKILFVTMFFISLFLMCGGCESERHEQREELRDRQSEQERSDQYRDKDSASPRGERHEDRH